MSETNLRVLAEIETALAEAHRLMYDDAFKGALSGSRKKIRSSLKTIIEALERAEAHG